MDSENTSSAEMYQTGRLANMKLLERFWSKIDKSGDCWEWIPARNRFRGRHPKYGQFYDGVKLVKAHRFSKQLELQRPISSEEHVLHTCDNPRCVRPSHLYIGTAKDNVRDTLSRGRFRAGGAVGDSNGSRTHPERLKRGEDAFGAQFTATDVREIRNLYKSGIGVCELARHYGVSHGTISYIVHMKTWAHVE